MIKPSISLLHPFTPASVGIHESDVHLYHSRPHVLAMEKLSSDGFNCKIEYITESILPYRLNKGKITWRFWPVSKRWHTDSKKWKKQWSVWLIINYFFFTPDITIINMSGHSSPLSMFLAKLIKKRNKKYIAMLGGLHLTIDKKRIEYYRRAEHIYVHTEYQMKEIKKLNEFTGQLIKVFPLGVDCAKYKPNLAKKNYCNKNGPSLLYVGRIVKLKRIHLAIQALISLIESGFEDSILKIVGPISSTEYYQFLEEMIERNNLHKRVIFEGFIKYDDLIPYYQSADLLLLPSEHESFGMVMIESMACGTPVAAIDCPGGPKEVIQNGENGLLTSVESYSDEITLSFKYNLIDKMRLNARKTVQSYYDIEKTYQVLKHDVENL